MYTVISGHGQKSTFGSQVHEYLFTVYKYLKLLAKPAFIQVGEKFARFMKT